MSSSFAFQFILCALTILQVHSDVITVNGTLGGFVTFHLDYPDLEQLVYINWQKENTLLSNRTDRMTTFSNGTLALKNTEKKDEGQYTVSVYNITGNLVYQRIFQLYVHGHINEDPHTVTGIVDRSVSFPLEIQSLKDLLRVTWENKQCEQQNVKKETGDPGPDVECDTYCNKSMCLQNGSLQLQNVAKKDEGKYEFELNYIPMKSFLLKVSEPTQIEAVHVRCLPGGRGEFLCNALDSSSVSFHWWVDGRPLNPAEACITDNGKRIILEKRETGELVCQTRHENSTSESSPIKLACEEGDLLKQPLFHYILVACGGGAVALAVIASLITCCCLKSKQQFIPVPSEEEKEEGMAMSVISKEETKSPPNGDHHEVPSASEDSPPKPESAETCQGLEEESEVIPDPEVVVDINNEDILCNTFPDPIDP